MVDFPSSGTFRMSRGGQEFGPFSLNELAAFVQQGRLVASDLLWTDGWAEWRLAGSISNLFPQPSPLDQLAQATSGQARRASPRHRPIGPDGIICPNPHCGYRGTAIRRRKGSIALLVILLLFWLLPGIIYAFAYNGYSLICPRCGMKVRDA